MLRYIALYWPGGDSATASARHLIARWRAHPGSWTLLIDRQGFAVLCAGAAPSSTVQLIPSNSGVIFGHIFSRSVQSEGESARILSTAGRHLVTSYWGNYVALLWDETKRVLTVLRAPAAALPCLHFTAGHVDIYLSRTEDAAALGEFNFTIDGRRLVRSLIGPAASACTAVTEIREILPAFAEQIGPSGIRQYSYWDPFEIAHEHSEKTPDFHAAAGTLRTVTQAVIQEWAQVTPRILLALSGGLDSSIVAACLHESHPRPHVTCLTHYAEDGADSDERYYARIVANRAKCEAIEFQHPADIDLRTALHGIRSERSPGLRIPAIDRIEPDVARRLGADATYKGSGGDELACRHHLQYYVGDYIREHGLRASAFPLLMHAAATEGETFWTTLARITRDTYFPRPWDIVRIFLSEQDTDQSLLNPELVRVALNDHAFDPSSTHSMRKCPPGRLWQISLITGPRPYYLPSTRQGDPPVISPLLSQPLIEAVLRIPTWFQMRDRRDRALSRAAFQSMIPREVLERRWKGGAEQHAWQILRRNRAFIRELLLGGRLVSERILDRGRVEAALSSAPGSIARASVPLFELIGAEAWLQAWGPTTSVRL